MTAITARPGTGVPAATLTRRARLRAGWVALGAATAAVAVVLGIMVGPADLGPGAIVRELLWFDSGLTDRQQSILWAIRFPRVVLGLLVGATLSLAGAGYQGVFRNPLADPYLLGAAAGAGLGVTVAFARATTEAAGTAPPAAPLAAFVGALAAVAMTYVVAGGTSSAAGRRSSTVTLILAGVAVASFLTAMQTYVQQRHQDTVREVFSWILGRLGTAGWNEVWTLLPYAAVMFTVLLLYRRVLDVLAVGDDEATALGVHAGRARLVVVLAATLGTAAAVSVSGLIGFVGIVVPHTVRMLFGTSQRVILPLSALFGGAFLVLADVAARSVYPGSEIPLGVVTAFCGAPFFVVVLRRSQARGAA